MFKRDITTELRQMAAEYPVVTLLGPRQSGKTTLVQTVFSKKPYVNLEELDVRRLAEEDQRGFLSQYTGGVIIDEAQNVPSLLSYIQTIVDQKKSNGMFILTGSHQLHLHAQVSQSLAGRVALLYLLPLSLSELSQHHDTSDENKLIHQGFLPRIYNEQQQAFKAYRNYLKTYIERDVRTLIHIKELNTFQKFITICASRVGNLINYDNMSNEIGVSNNTIKNWLSILEASFIIIRLQPYYTNIGKRLIKTPKLYFVETGLAAYLLGIQSAEQLQRDPLRGALFENMVVMDLIKTQYNLGLDHYLYFYRDQQGHEVDLIYQKESQLIPIEIKSSKTFHPQFLKEIDYFSTLFPDKCKQGYVIYSGEHAQPLGWKYLLNYQKAHQIIT